MAGIIFFKTNNLSDIRCFYINKIKMDLWLDQKKCIILKHENMLLGFCKAKEADICGIITFFYKTKKEVDVMFDIVSSKKDKKPKINKKFKIYHFFTKDPEGRLIEFQKFLHKTEKI